MRPEMVGAADSVRVEYGRTMRPGCVRASGDASGKGASPPQIGALPFPIRVVVEGRQKRQQAR